MTPVEAMLGYKPNVANLRVFGCICFRHIPSSLRKKLDTKAHKCMFMGYSTTQKAYRVWDLEEQRLVVTAEVKFDENKFLSNKDEHEDMGESDEEEAEQLEATVPVLHKDEGNEDQKVVQQVARRSERISKPNPKYAHTAQELVDIEFAYASAVLDTPSSFEEAMQSKSKDEWCEAMDAEISALEAFGTWDRCVLPAGQKAIKCKWVYATKVDSKGHETKKKARLTAKGFSQRPGIDYHDTYSPVVDTSSIRALMALIAKHDLEAQQVDMNSAFLNSTLEEEIYMEQPKGYDDKSNNVLRLVKAIYGLKQASQCWYKALSETLSKAGLKRTLTDDGIFVGNQTIVATHVDHMLIVSKHEARIGDLESILKEAFKIKELGEPRYFLVVCIVRDRTKKTIKISQEAYVTKILQRYGMQDAKPQSTPASMQEGEDPRETDVKEYQTIVGSLLYAALWTRPDIAHAVMMCTRSMQSPKVKDLIAAKRVLRYLVGTCGAGIVYGEPRSDSGESATETQLIGYSDASWADAGDRKSTSGMIWMICGGAIMWKSNKQKIIALSTAEAEYIAAAAAAREGAWLKTLTEQLDYTVLSAPILHMDNQSAIAMAKQVTSDKRTKHSDVRYHYLKHLVNNDLIKLEFVPTEDMYADALTKSLNKVKLENFCLDVGMEIT